VVTVASSVGAAHHHGLGAAELGPGGVEELDNAGGRARHHPRLSLQQAAGVDRVETVDVLGRVDQRGHRVPVDLVGDRKL
jgi:hypothetical protein